MSGQLLPGLQQGFQAFGTMSQGFGKKASYDAQAAVDDENARLSVLAGEQDVGTIMRKQRMAAGEALASMGSSDALLGSGSAADLIAESAMNADLDIQNRRTSAAREQANYLTAGQDKRAAGRSALIQAAFGTVSGVITGVANAQAKRITNAQTMAERGAVLPGYTGAAQTTLGASMTRF